MQIRWRGNHILHILVYSHQNKTVPRTKSILHYNYFCYAIFNLFNGSCAGRNIYLYIYFISTIKQQPPATGDDRTSSHFFIRCDVCVLSVWQYF